MGFTTDQILTLAKAGFTAEQIAALNMSSYPQNPQSAQAPMQPTQQMPIVAQPTAPVHPTSPMQPTQQMPIVAQPTPAPISAPVQQSTTTAPVTASAAPEPQATVDDVLKAVTGLQSTFQQTMLQTAVQPQPKTAEDILAEIINPPTKIIGGKQ